MRKHCYAGKHAGNQQLEQRGFGIGQIAQELRVPGDRLGGRLGPLQQRQGSPEKREQRRSGIAGSSRSPASRCPIHARLPLPAQATRRRNT